MSGKRWTSLVLTAVTVIALTAGCATAEDPTAPASPPLAYEQLFPNWPGVLNNFRFHWSAEPGIDITTGPALIARAYLESYRVATLSLDPDNVYPGFYRATPENLPRDGNYVWQLVNIRPWGTRIEAAPDKAKPKFGYEVMHFLDLTSTGNGYRAQICSGNYPMFVESESHPGKFRSVAHLGPGVERPETTYGVFNHQIELTQHDPRVGPNPPAPVITPQQGPAPAPDRDVFGDWFITGVGLNFWGRIDDGADALLTDLKQRCLQAMPQNRDERREIASTPRDTPPREHQAIPGWPMDTN